jgi:hypothetical protein
MNGNGRARKEAGMDLVAKSGDEELKAEKEAYRAAARAWLEKITGPRIITCEDLRRDLGDPPGVANNMGSIVNHLARKSLIKSVGRKHAERATRNDGRIDLYVKTEFYADFLFAQLGEVEAARKILEEYDVSLFEAAELAAAVCSLPFSTRRKIVEFIEKRGN